MGMADLGNAWHIPGNPEPRGRGGMRDPVGGIFAGAAVTIFSGNQFRGAGGNPGNQLQAGSSLFFRRAADTTWTPLPLLFHSASGNNKYYVATIPAGTFQTGDMVQYYLRIAYDDHDTTFLHAKDGGVARTADEAAVRATPFAFPVESSAVWGQWGPVFKLPNVAIHSSVLPDGHVLMWGRRDRPEQPLDVHECTPFLWDPASGEVSNTSQPRLANETKVNLFCSGHAFLPDGRLLVVGGHLADSDGVNQATLYDWATNTWTPTAPMNRGRWYPTATTLPDGSVLVLAGSYKDTGNTVHNTLPQVWKNGAWTPIAQFPGAGTSGMIGMLELYPRVHVAAEGLVFMSGPLKQTYQLDTSNGGQWTEVAPRTTQRDYCPAVMYDVDKVIYIGGGGGNGTPPAAEAEIIDLSKTPRQWRATSPMHYPRRQHNATLLPDGTVLVTGGTRGSGGPGNGFNDLRSGQPVHIAELWDPITEEWTELAAEEVDRCYHATAVLLPDATVLSAGGGEYRPFDGRDVANDPEDSHRDAQIFSPPYLFKGDRPQTTSAPDAVGYGETFEVGTPQPNDISKVTWIRLSSVTHAFNLNQRINFLPFQVDAGKLRVTAPDSPNVCPPGHYMLFILSRDGVPSVARIIEVQAAVAPAAVTARAPEPEVAERAAYADVYARQAEVSAAAKGTAVVVGITGTCPYGIGACWGGAYEALHHLERVGLVNPIANADDSTAEVFLKDESLPALDRWDERFRSIVDGRYVLRGLEVTLQGVIEERDGQLFLAASGPRPRVLLGPLAAADKIQWNRAAGVPKPLEEAEALAYERLAAASRDLADGQQVSVTGPLKQTDAGYQLQVRLFDA